MTLATFEDSIASDSPPAGISQALLALWYDGKGDWERAHEIAQDIDSETGAWIHAYLHRKEGDIANAHYWYRLAGKPPASGSTEDEWGVIAAAQF